MSKQDIQTAAHALLDAGLTGSGDEARHWATIATASLTAENERLREQVDRDDKTIGDLGLEAERLRTERDEARATKDMHKERQQEAELALSSLRELESAARAWVTADRRLGGLARIDAGNALVAAVDALPPTPPATEGSDG